MQIAFGFKYMDELAIGGTCFVFFKRAVWPLRVWDEAEP